MTRKKETLWGRQNPEKEVRGYYSKTAANHQNNDETSRKLGKGKTVFSIPSQQSRTALKNAQQTLPHIHLHPINTPSAPSIKLHATLSYYVFLSASPFSLSFNISLGLIFRVSLGIVIPLLLLICKRCFSPYSFSNSAPFDSSTPV